MSSGRWRRGLTAALACLVVLGGPVLVEDVTAIRLVPQFPYSASLVAFSGELIDIQLGGNFTPIKTSDPAVGAPLGGSHFIAAGPGRATLSAVSTRCPGCYSI